MKNAAKLTAIMTAAVFSSATYAGVVGAVSDNTTINVGNSVPIPAGPHAGWGFEPGIGVKDVVLGMKIPMRSLIELVTDPEKIKKYGKYGEVDANNVVNITPPDHVPGTNDPNPKVKMGVFNFQKIADNSAEVYFGEWQAKENGVVNPDTRSVYYVGKNPATNMPTTGQATYTVNGINRYAQNGLLSGTFNANFATNKLTGTISNSAMTLGVDTHINRTAASFSGTATIGGSAVTGTSNGHFFGDKASSLAGIAKFEGNRKYDTAFGGKKQ